jgi:hypothetical protein
MAEGKVVERPWKRNGVVGLEALLRLARLEPRASTGSNRLFSGEW